MKIAFIDAPMNLGGARIATLDLAYRLKSEHEVAVIDINGTCAPFAQRCNEMGLNRYVVNQQAKPFFVRSRNPFQFCIKLIKFGLRYIKERKRIGNLIQDNEYDFVIASSYRTLSYLKGNLGKTKKVFYAHGWYIREQISRQEQKILGIADTILCISESTRQALYNCGIAPLQALKVVHNSIKLETLSDKIADVACSKTCFKILISAGFTEGKGQHIALEIAKELKCRKVDFKLIICGIVYADKRSKAYYDFLLKKIANYNLEKDVELVVGKNNVFDYFRACDVLIHPSATEGLPLVIMEAMAAGKPVIANAVGGVTDFILDNYTGFLPNYNNISEYADIIQRLVNDHALYERIATNAFNLIKAGYTPEIQLRSFIKALS